MNLFLSPNTLIIDSSNIRNINGTEFLGRNYADKWKKGIKINVLMTSTGVPLNIQITKGDTHDMSVMESVFTYVTTKFKSSRRYRINILGDKGYTSKEYEKKFLDKKINYIVPKKKYNKNKNKKELPEPDILRKHRYKVERYFANLKQYTRLRFMYDRKIETYKSFLILGILGNLSNKIDENGILIPPKLK